MPPENGIPCALRCVLLSIYFGEGECGEEGGAAGTVALGHSFLQPHRCREAANAGPGNGG